MEFKNNIEKIKGEGIVHFWNLPDKLYVILDSNFKNILLSDFMKVTRTKYNVKKITGIQRDTISNIINKINPTIRIDYLLKIIEIIDKEDFNLLNIEMKIKWIGDFKSHGITHPKLPFDFNCRAGARFLAAICNEGWISHGMYYSNSKDELRKSVENDSLTIFGGNTETIKEYVKKNDKCLAFPSIMRDVVNILAEFKGIKSINNPSIPPFILENDELIFGWIEQTIADEGHVKYYPETYRREIVWRRSFSRSLTKYKLNDDERIMLDKIGISYDLKNIGTYFANKGIEKIRLQMRISKRENLLKLRKLIKIPHQQKDKIFTDLTQGFVRYKEPLKIKEAIIKICNEKGFVNSSELKKEMNYKKTNTACVWIKFYLNAGLLKCVREFSYGEARGREPAKYIIVGT